MEEGKKKAIMVTVTVVCLAAAGIIFYTQQAGSGGGGIEGISDEKMVWVLCRNPDCEASYQMGMKTFFKTVEERQEPMSMQVPALICDKCGEASVYRAAKCEKCELVFEWGSMGAQEFADRCPDCGYSGIEEGRKRRAAERRGE